MNDDSTPLRSAGLAAAVCAAYLAAGLLSHGLAGAATQSLPVWLAAGVAFGALLAAAPGRRLPVLLGTLAGAYVWGLCAHGLGVAGALPFALIEGVSIGAGAWLARRGEVQAAAAPGLRGWRVAWLAGGALLTATLGATCAAEYWRWVRPASAYADEWRAWAFSTLVGVLLAAPAIAAFKGFRVRRSGGMPMARFSAGATAFALFLAAAWISFGPGAGQRFGTVAPTLAYLPMPFLLLAALLWGPAGGSLAMLAGMLLLIRCTASGGGPFAVADAFRGEAVIEAQAFIAVWAVLVLLVQELSATRRAALADAKDWQLRYERVLEATGVASVEFDAVTGAAAWSRHSGTVLGPGIETLPRASDWLACVDPADRPLAEQHWREIAQGTRTAFTGDYVLSLQQRPLAVQAQWAAVRGPDGTVERVVALIRRVDAAAPQPGAAEDGRTHG